MKRISFTKFHALGNDFIVARNSGLPRSMPDFARAILDRHTGVGADGFIPLLPPRNKKHDARVRFFNTDGSEAEMSGNGIRCAAAFLLGRLRNKNNLQIETLAGLKLLETLGTEEGRWVFRVGMGKPILDPARIPFPAASPGPVVGFKLPKLQEELPVTITSMGNPHCTVFVVDFDSLDWHRLGRVIETHELFTNRTNAEFVKVVSRKEIEVRFWERGVGHTMSSGTGSCAATVACILNGLTDRQVRVRTQAGELEVAWPENGEASLLGPVVRIARGTFWYLGK